MICQNIEVKLPMSYEWFRKYLLELYSFLAQNNVQQLASGCKTIHSSMCLSVCVCISDVSTFIHVHYVSGCTKYDWKTTIPSRLWSVCCYAIKRDICCADVLTVCVCICVCVSDIASAQAHRKRNLQQIESKIKNNSKMEKERWCCIIWVVSTQTFCTPVRCHLIWMHDNNAESAVFGTSVVKCNWNGELKNVHTSPSSCC